MVSPASSTRVALAWQSTTPGSASSTSTQRRTNWGSHQSSWAAHLKYSPLARPTSLLKLGIEPRLRSLRT
jgi:hypothetical protein